MDQFGDTLVLQTQTLAMEKRLGTLVALLDELVQPAEIILRNDAAIRRLEGLPLEVRTRSGQAVGAALGAHRRDRVLAGPPGRAEDRLLSGPAAAARGGGRHAARLAGAAGGGAGARRVLQPGAVRPALRPGRRRRGAGARQRRGSIAQARRNAERNGLRAEFVVANVFDYFTEPPRRGLGPDRPRSAAVRRSKGALAGAMRGYKEINLRAMQRLTPGGVLATYSCSHHVQDAEFRAMLAGPRPTRSAGCRCSNSATSRRTIPCS